MVGQQHPGQDGHAPGLSHQREGGVVAADAGALRHGAARPAQDIPHVVVDALGGDDDPLLPQLLRRHLLQRAQLVAVGQHQQQLILHQRRQAEGLLGGGGQKAHIHLLFQDPRLHILIAAVLKADLHGGEAPGHMLDQLRQPADGHAADAAHRDGAGYAVAQLPCLLHQPLLRGQHGGGVGQQRPAVLRQADAHVQTLQKLRTQALLQPAQGVAGGGLGVAQLRGGAGDVAQLRGAGE